MVAFTERNKGRQDIITRSMTVVKGVFTDPVCKGVDAEGRVVDKDTAHDAGVKVSAFPVSPKKTGDECREDKGHEERKAVDRVILKNDEGKGIVKVAKLTGQNYDAAI